MGREPTRRGPSLAEKNKPGRLPLDPQHLVLHYEKRLRSDPLSLCPRCLVLHHQKHLCSDVWEQWSCYVIYAVISDEFLYTDPTNNEPLVVQSFLRSPAEICSSHRIRSSIKESTHIHPRRFLICSIWFHRGVGRWLKVGRLARLAGASTWLMRSRAPVTLSL